MAHFLTLNDDERVCDFIARALSMSGHTADTACNGRLAYQMVMEREYDAIITNRSMPEVDGVEFLRQIQHHVRKRVPCAMESGLFTPDSVGAARQAGALWFLELPFRIEDLQIVATQMVMVRRAWVAPDQLTLEDVRSESNAEIRRILREAYGDERYLRDTGATLVDVDAVPVDVLARGGATITRALLADPEGHRYLVASDGSTQRVYYMEVPASCATCQQAYEALSGRPGARTIVQA